MTLERNNLTKARTVTVAAIEERLPDLIEARDVVESFHAMLRDKSSDDLETWVNRADLNPSSWPVSRLRVDQTLLNWLHSAANCSAYHFMRKPTVAL